MLAAKSRARQIRCRCRVLLAVYQDGELHVQRNGLDVWVDTSAIVRIRCYYCRNIRLIRPEELK